MSWSILFSRDESSMKMCDCIGVGLRGLLGEFQRVSVGVPVGRRKDNVTLNSKNSKEVLLDRGFVLRVPLSFPNGD